MGVICYVLLSGSPPFYTDNPRLAISPGMKRRIHSAEYNFPSAQWRHISQVKMVVALIIQSSIKIMSLSIDAQDAKDLIRGCLRSNPEERLSISEVLSTACC